MPNGLKQIYMNITCEPVKYLYRNEICYMYYNGSTLRKGKNTNPLLLRNSFTSTNGARITYSGNGFVSQFFINRFVLIYN